MNTKSPSQEFRDIASLCDDGFHDESASALRRAADALDTLHAEREALRAVVRDIVALYDRGWLQDLQHPSGGRGTIDAARAALARDEVKP